MAIKSIPHQEIPPQKHYYVRGILFHFIRHYISTWSAWPGSGNMFGEEAEPQKKKHTHKVALIRVNWIGG